MIDGLSVLFLVSFGVGVVLLLLSALTGVGHTSLHVGPLQMHAPGHLAHDGLHAGHGAAGAGGHAGAEGVSPFNAMSVLIFLTWFGGAGYLLHGPLGVWGLLSLLGAALAGALAAALVFQFLARVLAPQSVPLDPADYRLEGQVGTVSVPIHADGVGEVLYSQRGRRRAIGARSRDHRPLGRGTEVVIVTVEHGLALVEPWEQFVNGRAVADSGAERPAASVPRGVDSSKEEPR